MAARLTQSSFEPGARLRLDAALTEYGLPVSGRAAVEVSLRRPDGMTLVLPLTEESPGAFTAEFSAGQDGIWQGRVRARGRTHYGSAFSREQQVSAAVLIGGDRAWQAPPEESELACLLRCLADDRGWRRWLEEKGIDAGRLEKCLGSCRTPEDDEELNRLG